MSPHGAAIRGPRDNATLLDARIQHLGELLLLERLGHFGAEPLDEQSPIPLELRADDVARTRHVDVHAVEQPSRPGGDDDDTVGLYFAITWSDSLGDLSGACDGGPSVIGLVGSRRREAAIAPCPGRKGDPGRGSVSYTLRERPRRNLHGRRQRRMTVSTHDRAVGADDRGGRRAGRDRGRSRRALIPVMKPADLGDSDDMPG